MASIQRIQVELTGVTGLPGVAVHYSTASVPSAKADVENFWDEVAPLMPTALTIRVPNTGDVIDDATGTLVGTWTEGSVFSVTGGSTFEYAAGVGARIQWNTNGIRNGRRIRGATFVCPLTRSSFDTSGTLSSGTLTTLNTAAGLLTASGEAVIWSRPTVPGGSNGESNAIVAGFIPDRVTALRSRRF